MTVHPYARKKSLTQLRHLNKTWEKELYKKGLFNFYRTSTERDLILPTSRKSIYPVFDNIKIAQEIYPRLVCSDCFPLPVINFWNKEDAILKENNSMLGEILKNETLKEWGNRAEWSDSEKRKINKIYHRF